MSTKKPAVLYHANCMDGYAAACVVGKCWGNGVGYFPMTYGQPIPQEAWEPERRVFILDFSVSETDLRALAGRGPVTWIDHHKTVAELAYRMEAENVCEVYFTTRRSGAMLTWDSFFPYDPAPMAIRYVEDRDLWHWHLVNSREFNAALRAEFLDGQEPRPREFLDWCQTEAVFQSGRLLLKATNAQVDDACSRAVTVQHGEWYGVAVNAAVHQSETCAKLLEVYAEAEFAVCYWRVRGGWEHSVRTRGTLDAGSLCEAFGGGGHPRAAGFRSDKVEFGAVI